MNINKNNYEAFFLDYHEGNLSPQQVADLLLFLEQHSSLKEEFENFENFKLDDYSLIEFENKSTLKKEVGTNNIEEYLIKSIEKVISPIEKSLLNNYIKKHPKTFIDIELFNKTKLIPDGSIVFGNKDLLKRKLTTVDSEKKERKIIPFFYYVAIAASVLLLFGLFFIFNVENDEQKLAKVDVLPGTEKKITNKMNENFGEQKKEIVKKYASSKNNIVVKSVLRLVNTADSEILIVKEPANKNLTDNKNIVALTNEVKLPQLINNADPTTCNKQSLTNMIQPTIKTEFSSLTELAITKLKQKAFDNKTLLSENKSGRIKKINGWDIAQLVAKGFSKITGKNIDVKPTYNQQGDVTAYALGTGNFQITRGR